MLEDEHNSLCQNHPGANRRQRDNVPKSVAVATSAVTVMLLLPALLLIISCMPDLRDQHPERPGTYKIYVDERINFSKRNYLLHVPESYRGQSDLPLVIVLHGAFSSGKEMERITGFSRLADRENFFVVYPNGSYGILGYLQHWNAGFCCGRAKDKNIDDVGFIDRIIDELTTRFRLDRSRVYLAGFSDGGMLAYYYGALRSGRIAAIAVLAASAGLCDDSRDQMDQIPPPTAPLSVLAIHSLDDDNVPFSGGQGGRRKNGPCFLPVRESIDIFRAVNQTRAEAAVDSLARYGMIVRSWTGGLNGSEVILCLLNGWGHNWPGRYFSKKYRYKNSTDIPEAADLIWQFFKNKKSARL